MSRMDKVDIDDTWDDETGRVRSIALQHFNDREARHNPTPATALPLLAPLLPLLYNRKGKEAQKYTIKKNRDEFELWLETSYAEMMMVKNGTIMLEMTDVQNFDAVKAIEKPVDPVPPHTQRIVDAVVADRSTHAMEPAPGELLNRVRGVKVIDKVARGEYRILRVTNAGDIEPQLVTSSHLTWAQYLGQHLATLWEHVPDEILQKCRERREGADPQMCFGADQEGSHHRPSEDIEDSEDSDGAQAKSASARAAGISDPDVEIGDVEVSMAPPVGGSIGFALDIACAPPSGAASADGAADGAASAGASLGPMSLLAQLELADAEEDAIGLEDETEYRCQLICARFDQFAEYLERPPERRLCTMCQKPGADLVHLPPGDYHMNGFEWDDPQCFCFTCRPCITNRMMEADLSGELLKQRCVACWKQHGGFQVHNNATKKLMLMQAATQVMLFCGPRREGEPEESFDQRLARRACLKAVVEHGFRRALNIPLGPNHATEFRMLDYDHLTSHGWAMWLAPRHEPADKVTTCYTAASVDGRLHLKLAEAEAQLENIDNALAHARRACELLGSLDKGQGLQVPRGNTILETGEMHHYTLRELGHPARALLVPAQELVEQLRKLKEEGGLEGRGGTEAAMPRGGSKSKGGKKNKGGKKR